ncbi:MAG TPA: TIGR01777 family oxidoreductase [Thermoleophilaceae bacterium]|nr:TIGR01777 family oxidoreductase [Thermoleophilaceae bacterium]
MRVAVTGATGTIGRALVDELLVRGDEVTVLSRDARRAREAFGGTVDALTWRLPKTEPAPAEALAGRDGVVHLLGEPIAQRWSDEAKREIRDSRVLGTQNLVRGLAAAEPRPTVLVSQSGEGIYPRGPEPVDESAEPARGEFLADIVAAWEGEAMKAADLGLRVVTTRTGVVLAGQGGALATMLPFFKAGAGGPVAGGGQYVSWIHLDDLVGALILCLDRDEARGPVNVTAPNPVTNRELSRALGRVLGRPAFVPVPAFALKLLYGEMAEIVITGANVVPRRLEDLGYRFRRPQLEPALRAATGRGG